MFCISGLRPGDGRRKSGTRGHTLWIPYSTTPCESSKLPRFLLLKSVWVCVRRRYLRPGGRSARTLSSIDRVPGICPDCGGVGANYSINIRHGWTTGVSRHQAISRGQCAICNVSQRARSVAKARMRLALSQTTKADGEAPGRQIEDATEPDDQRVAQVRNPSLFPTPPPWQSSWAPA